MVAAAARHRGRVYRSRATLLGWPLIDIQVRDPLVEPGPNGAEPGRARGWVAIGDEARGLLLAIARGGACGLVAVGGRSLGVVSLGGIACGLVASGGLAVGLLAFGGLGVGGIAIGGGAVGWQAAGGGAVAWDVACGGGAIAHHAAFGGLAIARDFAVGGEGSAAHFNDPAAKAVLLRHPLKRGMDWYVGHLRWVTAGIVALSVLPPCLVWPLMYRRIRDEKAPPLRDLESP
jgi:zinc protease